MSPLDLAVNALQAEIVQSGGNTTTRRDASMLQVHILTVYMYPFFQMQSRRWKVLPTPALLRRCLDAIFHYVRTKYTASSGPRVAMGNLTD